MAAPIRPLPRLKQLMRQHDVTVRAIANIIGRSESYVRKRLIADTHAIDMTGAELTRIAAFFSVGVEELGG